MSESPSVAESLSPPRLPPAYRLFSPGGVAWATAIGTPVAGGVVLAINEFRLARRKLGWGLLLGGVVVTVILIAIASVLPDIIPSEVVVIPQIVLAKIVAEKLQGNAYQAHLQAGGSKASNWGGVGVGFAGLLVVLAGVFFAWGGTLQSVQAALDMQRSVDMGHDEKVYYARGAKRDTAQHVADALQKFGLFNGQRPVTVLLTGSGTHKEIGFVLSTGAWDDPEAVAAFTEVSEQLADALGGKPFTLRLLDENMAEKKRIPITSTSPAAGQGGVP